MGDIDTAVRGAQELESVLEERFGAEGRGLHEKLSSVEHHIPLALVKRIRWIASLRNRVVHEGAAIEDTADFQRAVATSVKSLKSIPAGATKEPEFELPAAGLKLQRPSGSSASAIGVSLVVGAVVGFFAGRASNSLPASALITERAMMVPPAAESHSGDPVEAESVTSSAAVGPRAPEVSLADKAHRAAIESTEAHHDIDELWQTVRRNTHVKVFEA